MEYELRRSKIEQPSLAEMTKRAIEILNKGPKGYVLIVRMIMQYRKIWRILPKSVFQKVEGGRIDHALHENYAKLALEDTLSLENAVIQTMKLIDPNETLMVVTADHSSVMTINGYPKRGSNVLGLANPKKPFPYTTLMFTTGEAGGRDEHGHRIDLTGEIDKPLSLDWWPLLSMDFLILAWPPSYLRAR